MIIRKKLVAPKVPSKWEIIRYSKIAFKLFRRLPSFCKVWYGDNTCYYYLSWVLPVCKQDLNMNEDPLRIFQD